MVKNEEDIIEIFVRYHCRVFDHVFIINHASKDGTAHILSSLQKEGLPLTVIQNDSPYHSQGLTLTKEIKEVRKTYQPKVLMAMDADEFLVGNLLEAAWEIPNPGYTLSVVWKNYAISNNDIEDDNILKRITYRSEYVNLNQHKTLILGASLDKNVKFIEGCHELYYDNKPIQLIQSKKIHLAHFPIRSINQFMKKSIVGWINKVANPANNGNRPDWSHWKKFFDIAKKGDINLLKLQELAVGYSSDQLTIPKLIFDPVDFWDIDLKYSVVDSYSPIEAISDASEFLAHQLSLNLS